MIISANTLLTSSMHIVNYKKQLITDLDKMRFYEVLIFHFYNVYANYEYLTFLPDATIHQERVIFD